MTLAFPALLTGFIAGTIASAAYFAGLALGMRRAMRRPRAVQILMVSAALRLAGLLAVGWIVVERGGPSAFAGFGAAFLLVRAAAIALARRGAAEGSAS